MSHCGGNFKVSMASRKIHSVCGVTGGMLAPVGSTDKAKISLSLSSRNRWMIIDRPRPSTLNLKGGVWVPSDLRGKGALRRVCVQNDSCPPVGHRPVSLLGAASGRGMACSLLAGELPFDADQGRAKTCTILWAS